MSAIKTYFDDRIKAKNVLALNEKVAAIRRFEVDPVYKSVGRYFNCSPDQIKRIIKQKDEILLEWNNRTKKFIVPTVHEVKSVKMSFLGRAVYEWIRRMMYYTDFNLTNGLIQTMALEFKKALNLQNFIPSQSWIANFRGSYNLKDVNTRTLDIGYKESHSVQIRDILRYLQEVCGSSATDEEDDDCELVPSESQQLMDLEKKLEIKRHSKSKHNNRVKKKAAGQSKVLIKEEPFSTLDIEEEKLLETSCSGTVTQIKSEPSSSIETITIKSEPSSPVPGPSIEASEQSPRKPVPCIILDDVTNKPVPKTEEEAMKYVKLLEEFALLKADFRLIGLVDRLEKALTQK